MFKAAQQDPYLPLYLMAIDTGMREGELFALEWDDIDFGSGCVMVQRGLHELRGKLWV